MEVGTYLWCNTADGDGNNDDNEAWFLATVEHRTSKEIHVRRVQQQDGRPPCNNIIIRPCFCDEDFHAASSDDHGVLRYQGIEMANLTTSSMQVGESSANAPACTNNDGNDNSNSNDDLIELHYLNEPAILHEIHMRFLKGIIYTYAGPVLIAINPFQQLPLFTKVRIYHMDRY